MRSAELPDGRRVHANHDFERDWWTVTLDGRKSEARIPHYALRDLLDVPDGEVSPEPVLDAVQELARVNTPFGDRVQCRCCGYLTLEEYGNYQICLVCNWEDDPTTIWEPDESPGGPGPNHISLTEGRQNFVDNGISDGWPADRSDLRNPLPEERPER